MSSFVPITGQYGLFSVSAQRMASELTTDAFVVVEAGESVASLTMSATWIVCDSNTGVGMRTAMGFCGCYRKRCAVCARPCDRGNRVGSKA